MKTYGLLGKNISYSFSKNYFGEKFEKEQLDNKYINFDLPTISEFENIIKNPDIKGINVTIPYKQQVLQYLDEIDNVAKEIGAVNVIKINKNGTLKGFNSDYYGFKNSLLPLLKPHHKKALILGTGGASKAIAYALQSLGIQYNFVSRNPDNGELTYKDLDEDIIRAYKIIINCTPLGTHPDVQNYPDIPYDHLTDSHILYDLIYNPSETTFMKKGKDKGSTIINGLQMLVLQAEKSWEIWNT